MASSWGRIATITGVSFLALSVGSFNKEQYYAREAHAGDTPPQSPIVPLDPDAMSAVVEQGFLVRVFDTAAIAPSLGVDVDALSSSELKYTYVNDHTLIQAKDGTWHLFGIWHREPFAPDNEVDFIHAIAREPDPAKWEEGAFDVAARPFTTALHADTSIGETHIWAPHVVFAEGRYWMTYQGGGIDRDRSSIRLAESEDLYRWTRVGKVPMFEDICEARDPMLVRKDNAWIIYYTRCDSTNNRISGVAYRQSNNLTHWTEPRMVLTLNDMPAIPNSGYTESPFAFERNGFHYLSVTSYPVAWNATMLFRSPAPFAFPSAPFTRLRGHAGEWVTSTNGKHIYMTHAGPGQQGVLMSEISGL